MHVERDLAFALADRAAAAVDVEGEVLGRVAAPQREHLVGVDAADFVPGLEVGGGIGARALADGGLVEQHHAADLLGAVEPVELSDRVRRVVKELRERVVERLVHERALARARDARDDDEAIERDLDVDVLQVVLAAAGELEPALGSAPRASGCVRP